MAGAKGKPPRRPARRRSLNPSRVETDETLRITRAPRPPTSEALRLAASGGARTARSAPRQVEQLSLLDQNAFGELVAAGTDRTEYLSPPPSLDSERPRAREAQYNPDNRTLRVVFRNGGTYVYYGVPLTTWRALQRNRSFGQTLDRLVINQYPFEKTVAY